MTLRFIGADRDQSRLRREFERLVREHERDIFNAALRMAGNHADAEDVAQEALLKAYAAFERFELGTNFRAWILRILTNTYINEFRRRRRTPEMTTWDLLPREELGKVSSDDAQDRPEVALLEDALDAEVEQALSEIPEVFREAVLLCDMQGLAYNEIAEALGVPIGTVRSRIARGRGLLQERLREYAEARGLI
ncbi:MAG: sigma-70 family RNA polymerase sigma factor [candidate division WS1 bacterium]|jgi:RNA polymerase sigma-70 factor (ECF subfamily)|nr:sigma-70 family RNA polymerase sigma factor [candidate division WS1 bacterium]